MVAWHILLLALLAQAGAATPDIHPLPNDQATGTGAGVALNFDLLEVIASALGSTDAESYRLATTRTTGQLEAALLPTLRALPRNHYGKLDPPAVRYALHRLFLQEHAWRIEGLDPEGAAWNSSSPAKVAVLDLMPAPVRDLLSQHLGGQGLNSNEVAILAATIEYLIHREAAQRLQAAYAMLELPSMSSPADALRAVDLYMASYVVGKDIAKTPRKAMLNLLAKISDVYPSWSQTQNFVRDVLKSEIPGLVSEAATQVIFEDVSRGVVQVGERYGRWQDGECRSLKGRLIKMEDRGSGRVRLADFYGKALGGDWQFQESVPYLKQLGALDASNPGDLRVIIPNYVDSMSNCIGASAYHSVCCISECEALMGHLEREVRAPTATPEHLAGLVAALPSATVPANRSLSNLMLIRLRHVAARHGGQVPLHGRLFAQWMHHAYPRECPFPHLAGTTRQQSIYDLEGQSSIVATGGEMRERAAIPRRSEAPVQGVPWLLEEELLAGSAAARPLAFEIVYGAVALAACVTALLGLTRMAWAGLRRSGRRRVAKRPAPCPEPEAPTAV